MPGPFRNPEVHLDRVALRGVDLTGGTMELLVAVNNPNGFDLRGTSLQLGLDVEQDHVGDVTYRDAFRVQQGDSTMLTLPVQFTWSGLAGAVRTALGSGELPYTLKGELTVATPLGDHTIPFSGEGRVPLMRSGGPFSVPSGQ